MIFLVTFFIQGKKLQEQKLSGPFFFPIIKKKDKTPRYNKSKKSVGQTKWRAGAKAKFYF